MASYLNQPDSGGNCCACADRTGPCDDCGGGVCCYIDQTCSDAVTQAECETGGGFWHPELSGCDPNPCPPCPCAIPVSASSTITESADSSCSEFNGSITASASHSYAASDFDGSCSQFPEDNFCCLSGCDGSLVFGGPDIWTAFASCGWTIQFPNSCADGTVYVGIEWVIGCMDCTTGCSSCDDCGFQTQTCIGDLFVDYTFDLTDTGTHTYTESLVDGDVSATLENVITLG